MNGLPPFFSVNSPQSGHLHLCCVAPGGLGVPGHCPDRAGMCFWRSTAGTGQPTIFEDVRRETMGFPLFVTTKRPVLFWDLAYLDIFSKRREGSSHQWACNDGARLRKVVATTRFLFFWCIPFVRQWGALPFLLGGYHPIELSWIECKRSPCARAYQRNKKDMTFRWFQG